MSFAMFVDRARTDFTDMPGLELSLPQAVRLWQLGADDCRTVIDALVDAGFLRWTPRRTVVRSSGRDAETREDLFASHISVGVLAARSRSVGR